MLCGNAHEVITRIWIISLRTKQVAVNIETETKFDGQTRFGIRLNFIDGLRINRGFDINKSSGEQFGQHPLRLHDRWSEDQGDAM